MIRDLEELSLNAWASIQTVIYDGWLIRFSNGYTKRANSVNPIYESTGDLDHKIAYCENIFYARNLKPVFKMTESVSPKTLDTTLEDRGYKAIDHTSVQLLSLTELREPSIHTVKVDQELNEDWLREFCILNNQDESNKATMKQMLSLILPKTCFISLSHNDTVVAYGLGVLERGYLGIFDIVVDSRHRNVGFGEQLMLNLLHWGKENGAQYAYLQVMLNNAPALRLYSKLGFQEEYRYWYRLKV